MQGMELRVQEQQLVAIRRRATLLAVALVSEPFSAATDERLRAYLADDADEARMLARSLCELPEEVLRSRIAELSSSRGVSGAVGEGKREVRLADTGPVVGGAGGGPVWVMNRHGRRGAVARAALRGEQAEQ